MDLYFFKIFNKNSTILTKIIIFSYLTLESASISPSCSPKSCGNGPNIRPPFWIPQQQESGCGSAGFNITCKNNYPIIVISNEDYVVKDIFYNNRTFSIVSSKVFNETNLCPAPLRNFSVDGSPFIYSDLSFDLYFFYNCTYPFEGKMYEVNCSSNGSRPYSFAVIHPDILEARNYSIDSCRSSVHVPVHVDSLGVFLHENFTDVLRKGFVLEWQCSNCEKHGINFLEKLYKK